LHIKTNKGFLTVFIIFFLCAFSFKIFLSSAFLSESEFEFEFDSGITASS
jgi:hypothetical protein